MKYLKTILLFPLVLAIGEPAFAQVQRSMTFDAATSVLIQELDAMLVQNETGIVVEMMLGGHNLATNTNSDELQRGDLILMINGARVQSIDDIRSVYDQLSDTEELKLGVRRGNERFIVRAIKGDIPDAAPGRMVLTMDSESGTQPIILAELGLILSDSEDGITIQAVLDPVTPDELKTIDLIGFKLITMNGETFENATQAQEFLARMEVGDPIDLVFEKDGDQKVISLAKPEARASMSFSTNN